MSQSPARRLPSVDALLKQPPIAAALQSCPRRIVVDAVRGAIEGARRRLLAGGAAEVAIEAIAADALAAVARAGGCHYQKVINATGIILHTGLGRAVLAPAAIRQIVEHMAGYSLLQAEPETGGRSRRDGRIEDLLVELTGAQAATVVNNNAAATSIVLNTLCAGREVIVSRGQLVEIGGSFRLPEVMAASGATLVEVGATNKTHLGDYERAITPHTAAILRVHPSNYKIVGFTSEVPLAELVGLAHARGLVVIDDVGAGSLVDFSQFGFLPEPTLCDSVAAGADVITASADKLIGAVQGGLILGRKELVDRVRKNPMARIVRVDKLTLSVLEATLSLFLDQPTALAEVPTLAMLRRGLGTLDEEAEAIVADLAATGAALSAAVIDGYSQMGSGSLPGQDLPTRLVAVKARDVEAGEVARRLRLGRPPVFGRVHEGRLLLDPRTILEGQREELVAALTAAVAAPATSFG